MAEFEIKIPKGIDGERYRQMRERFQKWGPIRESIRDAFLAHQRGYYSANPVGKMEKLGPKILAGDYVHARGKSISVGVSSAYASAYQAWREKNGKGPLFDVDDRLVDTVVDIVEAYVILGFGASQKAKRRRK